MVNVWFCPALVSMKLPLLGLLFVPVESSLLLKLTSADDATASDDTTAAPDTGGNATVRAEASGG